MIRAAEKEADRLFTKWTQSPTITEAMRASPAYVPNTDDLLWPVGTPLGEAGVAAWALAELACSGNGLACMHLLRKHRIYDPEPPEQCTPGIFYSTSRRALAAAAAAGQLDACRLLLRVVLRDARVTGHLDNLHVALDIPVTAAVEADQPEAAALLLAALEQHAPHGDQNSFWARTGLWPVGPADGMCGLLCAVLVACVAADAAVQVPPLGSFALLLLHDLSIALACLLSSVYAFANRVAGVLSGQHLLSGVAQHPTYIHPSLAVRRWMAAALGTGSTRVAKLFLSRGIAPDTVVFFRALLLRGGSWLLAARLPETAFCLLLAGFFAWRQQGSPKGYLQWFCVTYAAAVPLVVCWALAFGAWKQQQRRGPDVQRKKQQ